MEGLPGALDGVFVGVMLQNRAVNAMAQAGGIWPIREDVANMRLALGNSGPPSAASVANDPHARSQNRYLPGRKSSASRSLNHTSFLSKKVGHRNRRSYTFPRVSLDNTGD